MNHPSPLVKPQPCPREITLFYAPHLLTLWKQGRLHRRWHASYKKGYCELDLSNSDNQCYKGWGFAECFTTRYFRRRGYEVLTSKYLHRTRPEKMAQAKRILGEAHAAFLMRRRRLGRAKPGKSPYPDLLVFKSSSKEFFFAEVKRDSDRLSVTQRAFFPMIERELRCHVAIVKLKARRKKTRQ